ncbi:Nuclear control of ATPase protein 2 [Mortierella antarctica]|nr:Nuclear control of ATPase protein 2 [Mortierella antarctica]
MGTFVTDKLQQLNNDLVQLFQLDAQALFGDNHHRSSGPSPPNSGSNSQDTLSEQADLALASGLRTSIEALDFRSGSVPPMERVFLEIEKVEALLSTGARGGEQTSTMEHLFLAKCTVAVHLNLLDIILNATLPLSNEIEYWQSLRDSPTWRLLYIVQTSPHRIFSLTRSVVVSTRNHLDSLIETAEDQEKRRTRLLQMIQYFPEFLKKHLISQPVSFPVAIHYEISSHRKQLQRIKEYQAECLGLLAEQGLNLNADHLEDSTLGSPSSSSSGSLSFGGENTQRRTEKFVLDQISKTVCLMERVLDKASKDTHHLTDPQQQKVPSRNAARSLTMLGNLHGVSSLSSNETLEHLKDLIQIQIPRYVEETEKQAEKFHRPSWLTRIWIPALMGYFALKYGLRYVSEHRADLDEFLEEAWDTAKRFVTDWVWEPSMRVMAIIRHTDDQGSLQMLGNESLKSDIASLERMVLDFGKEHYRMGHEDLTALSQAVHNGDISVVMRAYEQELKTPLKGAVAGHLVQTLLIQVQKTKVDVEVAMAALDKLLKANELNFAFLAVGPSLLLLWAVSAQAKSSWQKIAGRNLGVVSLQMKNSLRQVEKLLNLASSECDGHSSAQERHGRRVRSVSAAHGGNGQEPESGLLEEYDDLSSSSATTPSGEEPLSNSLQLSAERLTKMRAKKGKVPYRTQGLILCEVHLLRMFAARLTRANGLQDRVMEDLREIEESSLTVHQRLRTTNRMYRTYGFLGLHH